MQTKSIEIHQTNMFCSRCLYNVLMALSKVDHIKDLDIDLNSKMIKMKYQDDELSNKEIRCMINKAITTGNTN